MSSTTANRDATLMQFATRPHATFTEIERSHPSLLRGVVRCGRCSKPRTIDPATCQRIGWHRCTCERTKQAEPAK